MGLRWLFRVASRPEDGGGHMSRCLSLAKAMAQIEPKAIPVFVLDQGGEVWLGPLQDSGFEVMLEGGELIGPWTGALMDGYRFTDNDALRLKSLTGLLVVIDDLSQSSALADLTINSGCHLYGNTLAGRPALLGPSYALLGARYQNTKFYSVKNIVRTILVSFGRMDSKNVTGLVLVALARLLDGDAQFTTTVVLGSNAPHLRVIEQVVSTFPGSIELLIDVNDMPARLAMADLAIGGGGVSLLERMAAGVPSVSVIQADNQALNIAGAAERRATINAGTIEDLTADDIAGAVGKLMADWHMREEISRAGRALVDGCGAERVAQHLIEMCALETINNDLQ